MKFILEEEIMNKIGLRKLRVRKEGKHLLSFTTNINGYEFLKTYSSDDMYENYKAMQDDIEWGFDWVDENGNIELDEVLHDSIIEKQQRFNIEFKNQNDNTIMVIRDSQTGKRYDYQLDGILTEQNLLSSARNKIEIIKQQEATDRVLANGFSLD